jgi:lysylphosphatidylglycerol synthetase-like protein (DUF2156 family)
VFSRTARQAPLTLALTVLFWLVGAGTGILGHGSRPLRSEVLLDGAHSLSHPASLMLSFLWAPGLPGYVWGTVVLLMLGVFAERRLGTARYAMALATTHLLAASTVAVSAWLVGQFYSGWATAFLTVRYGGPTLGVIGAVLAASAALPSLWRRRVRAGGLTLFTAMVLFYGGGLSVLLLAATLFGLALGRLFRANRVGSSPVGSVHEARVLAAVIVAATALGPLLAMLTPVPTGPFARLGFLIADVRRARPSAVAELCGRAPTSVGCAMGHLNVHPSVGATLMACLPVLLLLLFAGGLRRGRRMAWIGTLALEGTLAGVVVVEFALAMVDAAPVLPIPYPSDEQPLLLLTQLVLPCLVPVTIVVVVLLLGRDLFTVRAPQGNSRVLARHLALLTAAAAASYVGLGLLVARQWQAPPTLWLLLTDFPLRLAPFELTLGASADLVPTGPVAQLLFEWVGVVFWACTAVILVRSFRRGSSATRTDRERARAVLVAHGGASLAWMGLWEGNDYWFSPTGATYVPYRLIQGVALTIGDPIGPPGERAAAVREFTTYCESIGAVPCFYSASGPLAAQCADSGWRAVHIAEETVLALGSLAFRGKRFQDVRTTFNRAKREGVHVEWINYPTAPLATVLQIEAISEEWVSQQSLPEMGFTLGGLEQLRDPSVRCSVVVDDAGLVHAVASWLPIYTTGQVTGWTLDFMRRRTDGFRHASELLIAQGALDFQAQGYAVVSLSGAPLARGDHRVAEAAIGTVKDPTTAAAGPVSDALDVILDHLGTRLEPVYGFRSLLRFKAKFDPQYRPMYLLYADAASLPAIGRAVARAYIPDASLGMLLRVANTVFGRSRGPDRRTPTPRPTPPQLQPIASTPRPPQSPIGPTPSAPSDVRTPAVPDVASTFAPLPATRHR